MYIRLTFILTALFVVFAISANLLTKQSIKSSEASKLSASYEGDHFTILDANNIAMIISNHGTNGPEPRDGNYLPGAVYPFISTEKLNDSIYDSEILWMFGPWLRGKVNGELRVSASSYDDVFSPGPIVNGSSVTPDLTHRVYKLYADSMENNPNQDYLDWPVHLGTPVDDDGRPLLTGHQTLWTVFNDFDPNKAGKRSK